MGKIIETYFEYADDDYECLKILRQTRALSNLIGSLSQNIAERYLKELVERVFVVQSKEEEEEKKQLLTTHNLIKLKKGLEKQNIYLRKETQDALYRINGFYFTLRCPGDESDNIDEEESYIAEEAATLLREDVLKL